MIRITDKSECCGCTACVSVCPVQCIVMRRDRKEGFDYPAANPDICIGCGKCEAVCPVLNPCEGGRPLETYAARSGEYLSGSASGGVFPLLAEDCVSRGGVVYGAAWDEDMKVCHFPASTMEEVEKLRGPKYVQSELYSTFDDIREELEDGREVLFSGTPCQVAGLRSFLGKNYKGFITVDFACHGVPGPGLLEIYLKALEKKNGKPVKSMMFRDKSRSWYHYDIAVNGQRIPYMKDPYMALFVQDMTLRPSCYSCSMRGGGSGSDITLADLWNAADAAKEMNDDRGVSAVSVNTVSGSLALDRVRTRLEMKRISHEESVRNNGGFAGETAVPEEREEFFNGLHSASDVYGYMRSFVRKPSLAACFSRSLRALLVNLKKKVSS